MSDKVLNIAIGVVIVAGFLMLPAGIGLAVWLDDPRWLFLSLTALIVFMA